MKPGIQRSMAVVALGGLLFAGGAWASVSVLTARNDNARSGANLSETVLTPEYVNDRQFGKLFSVAVDGGIWGQVLYVPNVSIPGKGVHNVVYAGTLKGSVYAFDADGGTGANAAPLWHVNLVDASKGQVAALGVIGTPVIDAATQTLYASCNTHENNASFHRLHALSLADGSEKFGGPVVVAASVPGTGAGSVNGTQSLPPNCGQRPGLLLLNGVVYIPYGTAYENAADPSQPPYHGWLIRYDAHTLQQASVFCTTPNGNEGGIWMSGAGPSVDDNRYIFLTTGNGTFDANTGKGDYGDSFIKLDTVGGLRVVDYATPMNQSDLETQDLDLGAGAAPLLPVQPGQPRLLVGVGKAGAAYVLNRDDMGGYSPLANAFVQTFSAASGLALTTPAVWNNDIYLCGLNDAPRDYRLNGAAFKAAPISIAAHAFQNGGATGSISANGAKNGILWMLDPSNQGSSGATILRAYDATDLLRELYNSDQNTDGLSPDMALRFCVPTIANGKVYVPSLTRLTVFGLLPALPGDVNNDGAVNAADVRLLLSMAAGLAPARNMRNADVFPANTDGTRGDGALDERDALRVLRGIAGTSPL